MQVYICAVWDWVQFSSLESYLEWINVSAFSASVNHESVKASISARNCNQASLLAGPSRPETQGNIVWVGPALRIPLKFSKFTLTKWCGMCAYRTHAWTCADTRTKRPHNEGICKLIPTWQICREQHCLLGITSNVIFVGGVDFFYSSVAEGQFSHPVHASPHACGQTKIGTGRSCMETVSAKVVRTEAKTKKESVSTCYARVCANKCHSLFWLFNQELKLYLRSWPLSSEDTSSICTWSHSWNTHNTQTLSNVGFTHS